MASESCSLVLVSSISMKHTLSCVVRSKKHTVGCPHEDNHQAVPKNPRVGIKATVFGTGYLAYPARHPDSHVHHR
jgi:hypothetical protein